MRREAREEECRGYRLDIHRVADLHVQVDGLADVIDEHERRHAHDGCMNEHKGFGRRSRAWAGAAAVGLAVIGVVSGGVGQASRAGALQGRYVALGDSITCGYSPLLEDPWIPERFVGYPEVIAQQTA